MCVVEQIEVSPRGDGEERPSRLLREDLVDGPRSAILQAGGIFQLGFLPGNRLLLALEEFLRGFPPGTEMPYFVEDDEVPIDLMQFHSFCRYKDVDLPRCITAQQVL